jgi:hypothetical protein
MESGGPCGSVRSRWEKGEGEGVRKWGEKVRKYQIRMEAWWSANSVPAERVFALSEQARERMLGWFPERVSFSGYEQGVRGDIPSICKAWAFEGSSRRSQSETVPFSPAVAMMESLVLYAFAVVRLPWCVWMIFRGPWFNLRGSKMQSCWFEDVAANPVARGMISRT